MGLEKYIVIRTKWEGKETDKGLKELERQAKEAARNLETVGRRIAGSLRSVGQSLTLYVTAPILAFGVLTTKTAADFETGMNRVIAISGATGRELEALKNQAEDLGATTQYSASQAADAMGFLAMAGFEANEILGAMPSTLQLAAAAQMDLGQAADITSNILTGYRLRLDELEHANDVLVTTFTSTNVSLQQLGEGMKYVAPIAAGAGVQFEEAAAAMGLLGNAGIQGSMAGTTLRGTLSALLNPTNQEATALARLGVATKDAAGGILPLADIIEQLEDSGATAGEVLEIFGDRAGPGMKSLIDQGSDALRDLIKSLEQSGGSAQHVADVQMQGFNGAMLRLKSATEGMMIAIGDSGLLDRLTDFAHGIAEWVSGFKALEPWQQKAIMGLTLFAASIGPSLIGLSMLINAILTLKNTIALVNLAAIGARLATFGPIIAGLLPILASVAIAVGVIIIAYKTWEYMHKALREEVDRARQSFNEQNQKLEALRNNYSELGREGQLLSEQTEVTREQMDEFRRSLVEVMQANPQLVTELGYTIDASGNLYDANGATIDSMQALQDAADRFTLSHMRQEILSTIQSLQSLISAQLAALPGAQTGGVSGYFQRYEETLTPVIGPGFGAMVSGIAAAGSQALDFMFTGLNEAAGAADDDYAALEDSFSQLGELINNFRVGAEDAVGRSLGDLEDQLDEEAPAGGGGARRQTQQEANERLETWNRLIKDVTDAHSTYLAGIELASQGLADLDTVKQSYYRSIMTAVQGMTELNVQSELSADNMALYLSFLDTAIAMTDYYAKATSESITNIADYQEYMSKILMHYEAMGYSMEDVIAMFEKLTASGEKFTDEFIESTTLDYMRSLIGTGMTISDILKAGRDLFTSMGGEVTPLKLGEVEIDDDALAEVEDISKAFLDELANTLGKFLANWGWQGGKPDVMGLARNILDPGFNAIAQNLVADWNWSAGMVNPIAGLISGVAGFAINRIFGGDEPLKIQQPVDMRLVEVSANLLNIFNWRGLDPFVYSSRYRGVYENGLY